eukprot:symbB.v1.2.008046.t1/scaffold501.1/size195062/7
MGIITFRRLSLSTATREFRRKAPLGQGRSARSERKKKKRAQQELHAQLGQLHLAKKKKLKQAGLATDKSTGFAQALSGKPLNQEQQPVQRFFWPEAKLGSRGFWRDLPYSMRPVTEEKGHDANGTRPVELSICGLDGQHLLLPVDLDSLGIDVLHHLKHLLNRRGAGELRILLEDKVLEPMRTLRDQ